MKVCNPANTNLIEEISDDTVETIKVKYASLKKGQQEWKQTPLKERISCLKRFKELLKQNRETLATLLTQEVGKTINQSRGEISTACYRIQFFLNEIEQRLQPQVLNEQGSVKEILEFEPLGVITHISPWNYPYAVAMNVLPPALISGNAVLYKPSEFSTLSAIKITELLHEAGIPEDVLSVVCGDGKIGEQLLELPLDGYFFTGSVKTGKYISKRTAGKMVPVVLELGGKDPLYVRDDVEDISKVAASAVDGKFYHNGQSCCAVERIYVHEAVYEQFIHHFVERSKSLQVGDPLEESTDQGPLTRTNHTLFLQELVDDALAKGAELLVGGNSVEEKSGYFEPTLLVNVTHEMRLMKEETFGPVVGIMKVRDDEEALTLMQDTTFGLTASIFSKDIEKAKLLLKRLDVGTAFVNCCERVSPYLPWSGRRESGVGSTLSYLGILSFVQPKGYHVTE